MKKSRKKYDAKFKAKVAIEAIKERETLNELSSKYGVSPVMISRWKKEFIENSAAAFETPNGAVLYQRILRFMNDYNYRRRHQGIDRQIPSKLYLRSAA